MPSESPVTPSVSVCDAPCSALIAHKEIHFGNKSVNKENEPSLMRDEHDMFEVTL